MEREARAAISMGAADAPAIVSTWATRRRLYRIMLRKKRESFWCTKVSTERSTPRQLWNSVDVLMGRGRVPITSTQCADDIHQFFNEKVAGVRASTDAAQPPLFTTVSLDCEFNDFRPLTLDVITAAVQSLPNKQCSSERLPTYFSKEHIDIMDILTIWSWRYGSLLDQIIPHESNSVRAFRSIQLKSNDVVMWNSSRLSTWANSFPQYLGRFFSFLSCDIDEPIVDTWRVSGHI